MLCFAHDPLYVLYHPILVVSNSSQRHDGNWRPRAFGTGRLLGRQWPHQPSSALQLHLPIPFTGCSPFTLDYCLI